MDNVYNVQKENVKVLEIKEAPFTQRKLKHIHETEAFHFYPDIVIKLRYSENATKVWLIFHSFFDITKYIVLNYNQIISGRWPNVFGLLRISEL